MLLPLCSWGELLRERTNEAAIRVAVDRVVATNPNCPSIMRFDLSLLLELQRDEVRGLQSIDDCERSLFDLAVLVILDLIDNFSTKSHSSFIFFHVL